MAVKNTFSKSIITLLMDKKLKAFVISLRQETCKQMRGITLFMIGKIHLLLRSFLRNSCRFIQLKISMSFGMAGARIGLSIQKHSWICIQESKFCHYRQEPRGSIRSREISAVFKDLCSITVISIACVQL